MREILFRGKRLDNGEWVEGNLFIPDSPDKPTEICFGTNIVRICYEVAPETVGQYTGLTDINGVKIFEGDIVGRFENCEESFYRIEFDEKFASFIGTEINGIGFIRFSRGREICEVVGNIYDNPEITEKRKVNKWQIMEVIK